MRSHRTRPCPRKVSRRLGETVVETIPGIRFYQVKSLEEKKRKKGGGRNSSSRRNLYPRYPPLGARSCGRAQKVNSSRLWASISRRSKLLPFSYLSAFVSARALSNDRPHPSPRAKSVVGIANAYIFLRNSSSFGIATFLPPTRPTAPSPSRNDLLVSS